MKRDVSERFRSFINRQRKFIRFVLRTIIILPVFYVVSFFFVFAPWYPDSAFLQERPEGVTVKRRLSERLIGPKPFGWACEPHWDGNVEGDENNQAYYTGEEWPFKFYAPLVKIYVNKGRQEWRDLELFVESAKQERENMEAKRGKRELSR